MQLSKNSLGLLFEIVAMIMLFFKGYTILKRRYKTPQGELDIVAKKGNTIVFVEVKARSKDPKDYGFIRNNQVMRIKNAANKFLIAHRMYNKVPVRFDLITLSNTSISHIKNAW